MNIGHKVAKDSCGYSKRPHPVRQDVENTQVEVLSGPIHESAPAVPPLSWGPLLGFRGHNRTHAFSSRQQGFKGQSQQSLDHHEEAEDLKGPAEAQRFNHLVEEHWEAHGEETGTSGHHAIG